MVEAGRRASDERATYRLVLWQRTHGLAPVGSLYEIDATPYDEPVATFLLAPDQPIPKVPPGGVVDVEGPVRAGERPTILAEGTAITPGSALVAGAGDEGSRIFADRYQTITHPDLAGPDPSWRHVTPTSVDTVRAWRRRIRGEVAAGWFAMIALLAVLAHPFVWSGGRPGVLVYPAGIVWSIVAWRLAVRSRRALRAANAAVDRPARPMWMRLDWTSGYGQGPMAVVSLLDAPTAEAPVARVSVVNVPAGFRVDGIVPCEVRGDPRTAPVVDVHGTRLWPAESSVLRPGHRRFRFLPRSP